MSIYTILTARKLVGRDLTVTELTFREENFGIASAVFSSLAARDDMEDCRLYVQGDGDVNAPRELIANRDDFIKAQRAQRQQQMLDPGAPPPFRR